MKKVLILFYLLGLIGSIQVGAQTVTVTLTTDSSFDNPTIIEKLENNLSRVLTEINRAQADNRPLNLVDMPLNEFAANSLSMLWANIHFYCDDEEVVERCWPLTNGYLLRRIPLIITPEGEEFGSGTYQEAIVEFTPSGTISDFRFALDAQLGESMEKGGNSVVETERRMKILSYCERFRTAYNTKDLNFLNQIFSDDALIITGTVVKTKPNEMGIGGEKVLYETGIPTQQMD